MNPEPVLVDFAWVYLWALRMGFSYREARHMTFACWTDFFDIYKRIHNLIMTKSTFTIQREESVFDGISDDEWDEVSN